ncbi:hypothetical protein BC829DRAFT_393618 [Chytridium lagenaria]|nr:hypothetical protein BC829DRAFT_393618 [Chytridium lagenaria]
MNAFFNATDLLQSSPSLEKLYKKVLLLDLGLCFQSMGDFSTAFRFLFGVESMDFASAVNRIMLCSGGVDGIPVQYVEGFEAGHKDMMPSSEMLRESLLGVKAVKSEEAQTTKVHFLEVARKGDKGSSLFKALSLVFLGGSFLDTNAVQAKKMFNMAKDVAVRCQFQLLAAFAHLGLKEVAIKEGVMEAVKAHDHGIQMHLQAYDVNVSASIPSPLKAH